MQIGDTAMQPPCKSSASQCNGDAKPAKRKCPKYGKARSRRSRILILRDDGRGFWLASAPPLADTSWSCVPRCRARAVSGRSRGVTGATARTARTARGHSARRRGSDHHQGGETRSPARPIAVSPDCPARGAPTPDSYSVDSEGSCKFCHERGSLRRTFSSLAADWTLARNCAYRSRSSAQSRSR
jgi:hypothetical protein